MCGDVCDSRYMCMWQFVIVDVYVCVSVCDSGCMGFAVWMYICVCDSVCMCGWVCVIEDVCVCVCL